MKPRTNKMEQLKKVYKIIQSALEKYFIFIWLQPVFFILNGYNQLFGFIPPDEILFNTGAILLMIAVLYFTTKFIFNSSSKGAVSTFIITLIILSFGYLHDTLKDFFPESYIIKYKYLMPVLVLGIAGLFFIIYKTNKPLTGIILYLNTLMVCLFATEIFNTIKTYKTYLTVENLIDPNFTVYKQYKPSSKLADSSKPDIYFLIFDEMGSSATLKNEWNINNYSIDTFLNQKGFYVVADGHSNYTWSVHSISSTFNMTYLADTLIPILGDPKSYMYSTNSILNNSLMKILKDENYDIVQYQNLSFHMDDMPDKSLYFHFRRKHFFYKTLPGRLYKDVYWKYSNIIFENTVDKTKSKDTVVSFILNKIKTSVSVTGKPKFIYGHFLTPHYPNIYDSAGNLLPMKTIAFRKRDDEQKAYQHELFFTHKLIKELVQHIQLKGKKNTIIMVAGDHGYRYYQNLFKHPSMYKNFNAIYFPDGDYSMLYPTISSVNTFRVVLNKYFKAGLPLLKDTTIYVIPQNQKNLIK